MRVAVAVFVILLGCAAVTVYFRPALLGLGGDPLASLSESVLSDRFTSGFWARERERNSDLWKRALALCAEPPVRLAEPRPNCAIVAVVADGGAQERLAREQLAERSRVREWLRGGAPADIGDGLTGRGATGVPSGFGRGARTGSTGSDEQPR